MYAVSEGGNVHLVPKETGPQRQISTSRRKKKKKKEKKNTPLSRGEAGDGGRRRDKYGLAGVRRLAGKVHGETLIIILWWVFLQRVPTPRLPG